MDSGAAAFNAHDIPNDTDCFGGKTKPLSYVVTVPYDPPRKVCKAPNLPNVRAILSWNLIPRPNQPNWTPPWGNVHDCHIQLRPLDKNHFELAEILKADLLELNPEYELPFEVPIELDPKPFPWPEPGPWPGPGPDPGPYFAWPAQPSAVEASEPLPFSELARLYRKEQKGTAAARAGSGKVGAERFGLQAIGPLLETAALDLQTASSFAAEWKAAGLDLSKVIATLADTEANTDYEELECVGLDYNLERLVGTFRVKLPFGFGGNLCGPGSTEYVAFWADWDDNCEWTYVGTAKVNLHDLPVPPEGLCYCATLPVDLNELRRQCKEPKVVRIRAVLSWAVPPSTTDPEELKYYGNRIDTHVQIRPGRPISHPEALIAIIGGIPTSKIDAGTGLTTPSAFFASTGCADGAGRPCPFAGLVTVQGPTFVGYRYRVSFRKLGAAAWITAADSLGGRRDRHRVHAPDSRRGWVLRVPAVHHERGEPACALGLVRRRPRRGPAGARGRGEHGARHDDTLDPARQHVAGRRRADHRDRRELREVRAGNAGAGHVRRPRSRPRELVALDEPATAGTGGGERAVPVERQRPDAAVAWVAVDARHDGHDAVRIHDHRRGGRPCDRQQRRGRARELVRAGILRDVAAERSRS